jgi:hypothetical protein
MSFDRSSGDSAPAPLPLQFVHIEIAPLMGGAFSVAMQATLLDEQDFQIVGQDLAHEQVRTLDEILAVIRNNVGVLSVRT